MKTVIGWLIALLMSLLVVAGVYAIVRIVVVDKVEHELIEQSERISQCRKLWKDHKDLVDGDTSLRGELRNRVSELFAKTGCEPILQEHGFEEKCVGERRLRQEALNELDTTNSRWTGEFIHGEEEKKKHIKRIGRLFEATGCK